MVIRLSISFLLCCFYVLSPCLGQKQGIIPTQSFNFKTYGRVQGLNVSIVIAVAEDSKGMIWLTTDRGVFKFDGKEFIEAKSSDVTTNSTESLFATPQHLLWGYHTWNRQAAVYDIPKRKWIHSDWRLGDLEYGGLQADANTEQVFGFIGSKIYAFSYQNQKIIIDTLFRFNEKYVFRLNQHSFLKDKQEKNLIWGTVYDSEQDTHYFFSLDIKSKKHHLYPLAHTDVYSLIDNIYQDEKGDVYFGVGIGNQLIIKKFDKEKTELIDYFTYVFPANLQRTNLQYKPKNELWLYTGAKNGFYIFNTQKQTLTKLVANAPLPNEVFNVIFRDSKGNLWIGVNSPTNPLVFVPNQLQNFKFHPLTAKINEKNNYHLDWWVSAFLEIPSANCLYVGTYSDLSLYVLDSSLRVIDIIKEQVLVSGKISKGFEINRIYQDKRGRIWVNARNGMYYLDTLKKQLLPYEKYAEMQKLTIDEVFYALYEDSEGYLWSGTRRHGVFRIAPDRQSFEYYPFQRNEAESHFKHIVEHKGKVYLGSRMGIRVFDVKSKNFIPKNELSFFDSAEIRGIAKDKKSQIWIAAISKKTKSKYQPLLCMYQLETKSIKEIPTAHLKKDLSMGHIIFDKNDDLWISFSYHFAKYHTKKEQFTFYGNHDFLDERHYLDDPFYLMSNGKLLLGEEHGYYEWNPDLFLKDTLPPNITFSKFQVNNRDTSFQKDLDFIEEIILPYDKNFIALTFSALAYTKSEKNQYAYQLVGYDKAWVQAGNRNTATYTDLPHGEYTLRVKASNHEGFWSKKSKSLKIEILPPLWLTWWAYTFYTLLAIALAFLARKLIVQRERLKASAEINALKSARLEEVDKLKSQFFANISHELRTPLTLIISPLEKLLAILLSKENKANRKAEGSFKEFLKLDLHLIYRNAKRLLEIINQLLDVAKLESGTMQVHTSITNISIFLRDLVAHFHSLGQEKNIDFTISIHPPEFYTQIDEDKISKIVNNLLSNAFKFTLKGGKVSFSASIEGIEAGKSVLHLQVSDTGIGIPQAQIEKVFERFYQVESSLSRKYEGSGIGLALTKELVVLLGGTIRVESEQEKGSTFWVQLPVEVKELFVEKQTTATNTSVTLVPEIGSSVRLEPVNKKQPLCLIVEDHTDMRAYLKECLQEKFEILLAENGKIGYEIAVKKLPDLIVTDVMMPIISGFELCKFLKENELTNHIPVLMLTAKATSQSKIEGIEHGADAYLVKPFYTKELMVTCVHLVKQRRVLREKFAKEYKSQIIKNQSIKHPKQKPNEQDDTLSLDEQFMQKVKEVVEANLSNADFDNVQFAEAMHLSTSQFTRKLRAIINQSPSDFVRIYRLHRAAEMLTHQTASISEVATKTGFENLSYFTKRFKEQFGKLPSEF